MKSLPSQTVDLIKELDKLYPDQMVIDQMDEFDRAKLAGKIELVRYLKHLQGKASDLRDVDATNRDK